MGYVSQTREGLDPRKTVYEEISQGAETMLMGNKQVPRPAALRPTSTGSPPLMISADGFPVSADLRLVSADLRGICAWSPPDLRRSPPDLSPGPALGSRPDLPALSGGGARVRLDLQSQGHRAGEEDRHAQRRRAARVET